jgi:hypothetical protein
MASATTTSVTADSLVEPSKESTLAPATADDPASIVDPVGIADCVGTADHDGKVDSGTDLATFATANSVEVPNDGSLACAVAADSVAPVDSAVKAASSFHSAISDRPLNPVGSSCAQRSVAIVNSAVKAQRLTDLRNELHRQLGGGAVGPPYKSITVVLPGESTHSPLPRHSFHMRTPPPQITNSNSAHWPDANGDSAASTDGSGSVALSDDSSPSGSCENSNGGSWSDDSGSDAIDEKELQEAESMVATVHAAAHAERLGKPPITPFNAEHYPPPSLHEYRGESRLADDAPPVLWYFQMTGEDWDREGKTYNVVHEQYKRLAVCEGAHDRRRPVASDSSHNESSSWYIRDQQACTHNSTVASTYA